MSIPRPQEVDVRRKPDRTENLDTESIIELIETCHAQDNTHGILKAASRLIYEAFSAETVAYTIMSESGAPRVFLSSFQDIGPDSENIIRRELSSLLNDIHRVHIEPEHLAPVLIHPDGLHDGTVERPRILWSVDIGPAGQNMGSLAVFGSQRNRIDERTLLGLRSIGRVLGAALDQSITSLTARNLSRTPGIIEFRIEHIHSIREAFGAHQTNRLKVDIAQRIVESLPRGAAVARIHDDGITAIISDPSVDLVRVQTDCLRACRGLEVNERILVKVSSVAAATELADETQVAALRLSTPVNDHAIPAVGDHTH